MAEEHDAVIAGPDYLTTEFADYNVVVSGGHWSETNPLENLLDELLSENAQSASAAASATVIDVDLGTLRSIKFMGFPDSDISRDGRVRVQISDAPAWQGMTLSGIASSGASTVTVRSAGSTTLTVGDVFSIDGHKDSDGRLVKHKFAESTTLATGVTATLDLNGAIASTFASGAALLCHTGDFSTATVSSIYNGDWEDWWPVVYDLASLSWPLKSWDGKLPDEEAEDFPKQWFNVFENEVLGRYIRTYIEDTANENGSVSLARMFVAGGWYGDIYLQLGASLGWDTTTTMNRSKANAKHYNKGVQYRRTVFTVPNVDIDEALQQAADMVKRVGIHRQVWMVLDKDDAPNRHRLSFIGHLSRLEPQQFINFDANSVAFIHEEDTQGEL